MSPKITDAFTLLTSAMPLAVYVLAAGAFIIGGWSSALVGLALAAWLTQGAIRVTKEMGTTESRPTWEAPSLLVLHWLALTGLLVVSVRALI